jgi:hypothetical protein
MATKTPRGPTGAIVSEWTYSNDFRVVDRVNPDEFTLTHYGFPEPALREVGDKRWYVLMSAAAVFIVAAVGLRVWVNRRRTANN